MLSFQNVLFLSCVPRYIGCPAISFKIVKIGCVSRHQCIQIVTICSKTDIDSMPDSNVRIVSLVHLPELNDCTKQDISII